MNVTPFPPNGMNVTPFPLDSLERLRDEINSYKCEEFECRVYYHPVKNRADLLNANNNVLYISLEYAILIYKIFPNRQNISNIILLFRDSDTGRFVNRKHYKSIPTPNEIFDFFIQSLFEQ